MQEIREQILESIRVKQLLLEDGVDTIKTIAKTIIDSLKNANRVYLMGNGGSAADAQHIAGEMVGRYKRDRAPLPVMSFTTDTSVITAIGNDFGYDECFVRQTEAFVKPGDVLIGISTSGNSENIIKAMNLAGKIGAATIALTGASGGALKTCVDICLAVPSTDTPRIQEAHITVAHILCSMIEEDLYRRTSSPDSEPKQR